MARQRDHYKVLGLKPLCSEDEIKAKYKELAKKNHPDLNPDKKAYAHEIMKQISAAYDTLSDYDKRKAYDESPFFQLRVPKKLGNMAVGPVDNSKKKKKEGGIWESLKKMMFVPAPEKEIKELTREAANHFSMGLTFLAKIKQDTLEVAKIEFQEVLSECPANFDALYNLGIIEYKMGNYTDALHCFKKAQKNMEKRDPHIDMVIDLLIDEQGSY